MMIGDSMIMLGVTHTTTYLYSQPVSLCHTDLRLKPRGDGSQHVLEHQLSILPEPDETFEHLDYFGNQVTYFSLQEPHQTLTIIATSIVEKQDSDLFEPCLTPAWEEGLYVPGNAVTSNAVTSNAAAMHLDDYE